MAATMYKIVERGDTPDTIKTLFHGVEGSRSVPRGKWIKAKEKMVKDGTSKTEYLSGWHVLPTKAEAEEYLTRFKERVEDLIIVRVLAKNMRAKHHSPDNVWLAQEVRFAK